MCEVSYNSENPYFVRLSDTFFCKNSFFLNVERNVNLTTFYNPQKPLIYNGFRYIFYKKFDFLKCI